MLQETFRWNGITNKKKMQKWGIEKTTSHRVDYYKHSSQDCYLNQNAEEKEALLPVDFDMLKPYAGMPKVSSFDSIELLRLFIIFISGRS